MYNNVFGAQKRVSCYFNDRNCIYVGVDIMRIIGCLFCLTALNNCNSIVVAIDDYGINEFGEAQNIPRNAVIVSRYFIKIKGKEMEKKREFYPMITQTVKTLIQVSDEDDAVWILIALKNYPEEFPEDYKSPIIIALLDELNRQYARWNKGENNGTR